MPSPRQTQTRTADMSRLVRALGFSIAGLKATWSSEAAFRQEVLVCILLIPLGLWLGNGGVEKFLLVSVLLLVLVVELLNSGIEALVDHVSEDHYPLLGMAKDAGSAAVLLSIINAILAWALIILF